MKLWEILKVENSGKIYESNKGVIYQLSVDSNNTPVLSNDILFTQKEFMELEFEEVKSLTGWERVDYGQTHYYIDYDGQVEPRKEINTDDTLFRYNNYFATKEKAIEVTREQKLYRRMKKFYDENDGSVNWNKNEYKYYIIFDHKYNIYKIYSTFDAEILGAIQFSSENLAKKCIDEVIKPFDGNKRMC